NQARMARASASGVRARLQIAQRQRLAATQSGRFATRRWRELDEQVEQQDQDAGDAKAAIQPRVGRRWRAQHDRLAARAGRRALSPGPRVCRYAVKVQLILNEIREGARMFRHQRSLSKTTGRASYSTISP